MADDVGVELDKTFVNKEKSKVYISHPVKQHVRESVGIPEDEPVALVVHITSENVAYDVVEHGFVNVSERGTLSSILDTPSEGVVFRR